MAERRRYEEEAREGAREGASRGGESERDAGGQGVRRRRLLAITHPPTHLSLSLSLSPSLSLSRTLSLAHSLSPFSLCSLSPPTCRCRLALSIAMAYIPNDSHRGRAVETTAFLQRASGYASERLLAAQLRARTEEKAET